MRALQKSVGLILAALCAVVLAQENTPSKRFPPPGFLFGCATSAYQIEGAWNADGKGASIWDTFVEIPGTIADNTTGEVACDHYHRYKEDVQLFKKLGVNHYSFTISWTRILPDGTGAVNPKGIEFYNNLVDELIENGITPIATLYHWDLPQKLQDKYGGWLSDEVVTDFAAYARIVFGALSDRVHMWVTMNEPTSFCFEGYRVGGSPPNRCSDRSLCQAGNSSTEPWLCGHHALNAHAAAVNIYRTEFAHRHPGQIAIILDNTWSEPLDPSSAADIASAERSMQFYMGWLAHPIWIGDYPPVMREAMGSFLPTFTPEQLRLLKGSADFFTWDAYTTQWTTPSASSDPTCLHNPDDPQWPECVTELQQKGSNPMYGELIGAPCQSTWEFVVPRGMKLGLQWINERYHPPAIYVTENGMGEPFESQLPLDQALTDVERIYYYKSYLESLQEAWNEGIPIKGYIFWSCMDNFEWSDGLNTRFGVIHVNFHTLQRTFKASAYWLRDWFYGKYYPY